MNTNREINTSGWSAPFYVGFVERWEDGSPILLRAEGLLPQRVGTDIRPFTLEPQGFSGTMVAITHEETSVAGIVIQDSRGVPVMWTAFGDAPTQVAAGDKLTVKWSVDYFNMRRV